MQVRFISRLRRQRYNAILRYKNPLKIANPKSQNIPLRIQVYIGEGIFFNKKSDWPHDEANRIVKIANRNFCVFLYRPT